MKINENLTPMEMFQVESKRFLTEIIEEIQYNPPPPLEKTPNEQTPESLEKFYQEHYVLLDSFGDLPVDCSDQSLKLSSYEKRVINFCSSPRSETRICVLHGHTGVGKSTLLRRVVYYIYPKCPELRKLFTPIYLRLTPNLISEDPDTLCKLLQAEIIESIYTSLRDTLLGDLRRILTTMNLQGRFITMFSDSVIEEAVKLGGEKWINNFFSSQDQKYQFLMDLLRLLIREKGFQVVLILDDVDRHAHAVHTCVFLALDTLAVYGISCIVSMRTSTYLTTSVQLLEYRDQKIELLVTPDLIRQILNRRLELLEKTIQLEPDIPYKIAEYHEVKGKDVVECFCSLISRGPCMKALIHISNTNLKSVFLKLELMSRSDVFSDEFIVRQLLERDLVEEQQSKGSKIWIFYHLLLGNYAGTFRSSPDARKAGLINLFDSSMPSNNNWRHFIRINLLIYLYKYWRKNRNENAYIGVADIQEEFKQSFGTLVGMSLLMDAINALVESELVFMESCRRYFDEPVTFKQYIFSDAAQISYAGKFYLENLLHKVEYLYFIKDDIDWSIKGFPKNLRAAQRDYNRPTKFESLLSALSLLQHEEYNCLAKLKAYWSSTDEGTQGLSRYRDLFSPYDISPRNDISICDTILNSYQRFMMTKMGDLYKGSKVERLINELNSVREENEGIKKTFLQA